MKQLVWLSFTTLLISFFSISTSYAAFPINSSKTTVVTSVTPPAPTMNMQKQTGHTSFMYKVRHATDSLFGLFSLLSLIFGALGLIVAFFSGAGFALGLVAVILGAIGLYMGSERMMATLGIILGLVAIIIALIL